jgi:hypothetical protein
MKAAREFTDGSELKLWEGNRKIVAFGSDQPQIVSPLSPSIFKATFKRVNRVGGFSIRDPATTVPSQPLLIR